MAAACLGAEADSVDQTAAFRCLDVDLPASEPKLPDFLLRGRSSSPGAVKKFKR